MSESESVSDDSTSNGSVELVSRANPVKKRARIEAGDVRLSALMPLLAAIAWLAPRKAWPWLSRNVVARLSRKGSPEAIPRGIATSGMAGSIGLSGEEVDAELNANRLETYLQYLCDYRPGGWNADFAIENEDALKDGVRSDKGVILWVAHFVFNGLPVKKGLREAGYLVSHLSRPEHGFSSSLYGVRVLNPIRSHIELRYLKQRVIIQREAEHIALRNAHKLLRKGEIVSFTAGAWEGRQIAKAPMGTGRMPLATGAPALAQATGANLLPVFIARDSAAQDRYTITIGSRIDCSDRDRETAVRSAVADFAGQLEPHVRAHPDQWRGWKYLESGQKPAGADTA